jgi:hypothetical protein
VRRVAHSKSIEAGDAKTPFTIALAALVLLIIAPAMVHPVARHVVFFKALRKPATSSVPWAVKTRATS